MEGCGTMLVTSVGSSTKHGGIITSIYQGNDAKRNPLFHQLESLNSGLETISAVISLLFIIVRLVSHYTTGADNHEDPEYVAVKTKIMQTFEALHQGVGLNTADAFPNDSLVLQYGFMDTATEKALLSGFTRMGGLDFSVNLKETHYIIHTQVLENRQCGVLIRDGGRNGNIFSHWKGHPTVILKNCSRYYDNNGVETSMDVSIRERVNDIVADMELRGLFCIAFAMKMTSSDVTIENNDLNLLRISGLKQEIQEDARKEMQSFKEAGFNINITTDDDISAANSLAFGCGFSEPKNIMEHLVALDNIVKIENVIAESSSYDEYKTVNGLKQGGDVVTIYGIESEKIIPVFAEANIGISTRIPCPGTKEEMSDMVISNNSLTVLHRIFVLARCYPSIQKYLQLCLTMRIIWLEVTLFEAVSLVEAPVIVFQLLWVEFITGTIGALVLGRENEESKLKPPIKRHKSLITKAMWRNIMGQVLHQIVVILFLQFQAEAIFNVNKDVKAALAFNTLFLCQIFNCFNVGIDWKRLWIMGIVVRTQVLMMQVLPIFTRSESLTLLQWVLCLGLAVLSIPANWVQKRIITDLLI